MANDWHILASPDEIPSPALLVYPERIEENIHRMVTAIDAGLHDTNARLWKKVQWHWKEKPRRPASS